jgi:hypothetical protein
MLSGGELSFGQFSGVEASLLPLQLCPGKALASSNPVLLPLVSHPNLTVLFWQRPSALSFDDVHMALAREKQLKGWSRAKKVALIEAKNPHWLDLAKEWYPWMKSGSADGAAS